MTWHQWQAAYPTDSSTGTSRARGLRERLVRPLPPVDGVVGVLQQVRAGRVGEPVRHGPQTCQARVGAVRAVVGGSAGRRRGHGDVRRRSPPAVGHASGAASSAAGSNDAGTFRICLFIDRSRNTVAMPSSRMTTSPTGDALPNSGPLSGGGRVLREHQPDCLPHRHSAEIDQHGHHLPTLASV